jgi:hypothetical protein
MTVEFVLMLVALILFILAAVGVSSGRYSLTAAGLAFLTGALLLAGPLPY